MITKESERVVSCSYFPFARHPGGQDYAICVSSTQHRGRFKARHTKEVHLTKDEAEQLWRDMGKLLGMWSKDA